VNQMGPRSGDLVSQADGPMDLKINFCLTICVLIGAVGCASSPLRTATQEHASPLDSRQLSVLAVADGPRNPQSVITTPAHAETHPTRREPEPAAGIQQASHVTSKFTVGVMHSLTGGFDEGQAPEATGQDTEPLQIMNSDTADDEPAAGMTLEQLQQLALENNPAIRQASAAAQKAIGIRQQVGRFPNPEVGYFGSQIGDAQTDQNGGFINQDFVLGHKLALNERVLNQDVQVQLWEVEAQRYRVLTDIRLRFVEALTAQRRLKLTEEFLMVAQEGVRIAQLRKDAMEGSQPEVLQAEIQMNEVIVSRQRAQFAFDAAWKELTATAGVPDMAPVELIGSLESDVLSREWDAMYQNIVASSPELRAAYSRIERARANLERQRVQPIPNLQVQLHGGTDLATNSSLMNLQVGMPIPIFNRNRGNINAAYSEYVRATQNVRRLELSLKARLAGVAQEFDSAAVTVQRYETQILPKARDTLTLSEQAYAAGEFNFLQVLIARRTFFETNLQYVQALSELAQADATVDGLLLTGGLTSTPDFTGDDGLRGHALSGQ
jgi:outer membrane protein, heavy metal efflux system